MPNPDPMSLLPQGSILEPAQSTPQASPDPMSMLPAGAVLEPAAAQPPAGPSWPGVQAPPQATAANGSMMTDAGRFLGTAAANAVGGVLSLPRTAASAADWAAGLAGYHPNLSKQLGSIADPSEPGVPLFPDYNQARDLAFGTTGGTEYLPTTLPGRVAMGALSAAIPAAATGGASLLANGVSAIPSAAVGVGTAAASGAGAQAGSEMTPDEPLVGGILGSLVPGGVAAIGGRMAAGSGVPGLAGDAGAVQRAQLAERAQGLGVPIYADQTSPNRFVKMAGSMARSVPLGGGDALDEAQREAFTHAVGSTFGANSPRLTPDVMQAAKSRIGDIFNQVGARTTVQGDPQLQSDLNSTLQTAASSVTSDELPAIQSQVSHVQNAMTNHNGALPGSVYLRLTAKGAPLDTAMSSSNPNIAHYAGEVREALDGALARSATPADQAALSVARSQWKAMRTVEPLAAKSTDGTISAPLLMNRVVQSYKNKAYSGAGTLGDLAAIGQQFIKPPPSSGTAERLGVMEAVPELMRSALPFAAGAGIGEATGGGPLADVAGALAPVAAARVVNAGLSSPIVRNRMIAAALNPVTVPRNAMTQALAAALLNPALTAAGSSGSNTGFPQ